MKTSVTTCILVIGIAMLGATATEAAQPQPVVTERIGDVTLSVLVEGGQLLLESNEIVLELRRSPGQAEVSDVTLIAARPGGASAPVNVALLSDGPGHFHGTMTLPWTGACRLEVGWQDEQGRHSYSATVPVVTGHH